MFNIRVCKMRVGEREREERGVAGLQHCNTPPLKTEIRIKKKKMQKIVVTICNIHTIKRLRLSN